MIGLIILLLTLCLLVLNYIDSNREFKFLSDNRREFAIRHKKFFALIFSGLIALMVCIDSFLNNSNINALKDGQNEILTEIVLTEKKKDSITNYYTSKLEVKGEELVLAQTTIRRLLDQLDYYNKSTDEIIRKSYNLFLEGEFEEAIALLEVYVESATEKRLINIYNLKVDLFKAQARFEEALSYSEKLFYLEPNIETKFNYAELLFVNHEMTEAYNHFINIHQELEKNADFKERINVLHSLELFHLYYYIGRINAYSGNFPWAISSYFQAEKYLREYDGVSSGYYNLILINAIGISFYQVKDYQQSEEILTGLINKFKRFDCAEPGCVSLKALVYSNLANTIRVGRKDYELALEYLLLSEDLLLKIKSNSPDFLYQICGLRFNKGMTYKGLQNYQEAEQNFQRSIELIPATKEHLNHDFMIIMLMSHFQLAELYKLNGEEKKSLENYSISSDLIKNYLNEHSENNSFLELKDKIEKAVKELD